jgi:hypothetical protein
MRRVLHEELSSIVSNVDFDDVVSLGGTCKAFGFLHIEESICKSVVQVSTDAIGERDVPKRETGKSSRRDIRVR